MSASDKKLPTPAKSPEVAAFLAKIKALPVRPTGAGRGRLLFGLDATASRQPTWDRACHIQSEMFAAAAAAGGLSIQLAYYRGFEEFQITGWLSEAAKLQDAMARTRCLGGMTQIGRLLDHALAETRREKIHALVFVGDAMEEDADALCHRAGQLGLIGVPIFIFHEGGAALPAECFKQMAKLSKGAYCRFDNSSASELAELLKAVAIYAAGGLAALEDHAQTRGGQVLALTHQLRR